MADVRVTVRAAPTAVAARHVPDDEMRDRLVELRLDGGRRSAVAFYFVPGDAPDVARQLRAAANELDAIYQEIQPI